MKSLQILSILSLEKLNELKEAVTPKIYYSLTYKNSATFNYNSIYIFEDEEQLVDYLIIVLDKDLFPLCENCYLRDEASLEQEKWTKEEVKEHFLTYKHYKIENIMYTIEIKNVISKNNLS